MKIVHLPEELRGFAGTTAFVPTMGALHDGHLELVRQAKSQADRVVVSVFVNPTQFGPNEDFTRYPRNLERDSELAGEAGADLVYAPSVETMYLEGESTRVQVSGVTDLYEGAHRPGHFDGVATVVLKLFNQVRPDVALFGRKDLQQCAVIAQMVRDLAVPVRLSFVPTVRETDGLAMSSRNVYLSPEERAAAPTLYASLRRAAERMHGGLSSAEALTEAKAAVSSVGFVVDYLDLIDANGFTPSTRAETGHAIVVAARLGKTRLIDNLEF